MNVLHRLSGLAAVGLMMLAGGLVRAQEPEPSPVIPFDGPEVFTYLLQNAKFDPVDSVAQLRRLEPRNTMIIVFGTTDIIAFLTRAVGDFAHFVSQGGSVLIVSDFPDQGRLESIGVRIAGDPVAQARHDAYKQNQACPLLRDEGPGNATFFRKMKITSLATNRPSFLTLMGGRLHVEPCVTFPASCYAPREVGQKGRLDKLEPLIFERPLNPGTCHYIVGTPLDAKTDGRAMVVAGHALFTNGMMLQPDNENFEFAVNLLRWLGATSDGTMRQRVFFVVDEQIIESFDNALRPPPLPIPIPTLQLVNQLLAGMEHEGFVLKLLRDNVDIRLPASVFIIVLTAIAWLLGVFRLLAMRHRPESGSALLVGAFAPQPAESPLVHDRFRSKVERDALWEDARALARAWFAEAGNLPATAWNQPSAALPGFTTTGGWWESYQFRRKLESVWQLARQQVPETFSWQQLVRLTKTIQDLTIAIRDGRLRF